MVERFAPSPTGALHLGHAYSALLAWQGARSAGGRFLLRLEDLDRGRSRPEYAKAILHDLAWLGLDWDGPVLCQSLRLAAYALALERLSAAGLVYRCTCTRRDIAEAASAPQEGVPAGPDGPVYPGTCRNTAPAPDTPAALRLDMRTAIAHLGGAGCVAALWYDEIGSGPNGERGRYHLDPEALVETIGDIVVRRRDGTPAYHLAVTIDDAYQNVSHVTRGQDLFSATPIHRLLQALLGLDVPVWRHHRLIRDETGRRLAKRNNARALASLRAAGESPASIRARLGV
ncbi:MAG: tRNA glutamyl-Q(34) synthetase GluQRS [Pseudomonadota bacterium]